MQAATLSPSNSSLPILRRGSQGKDVKYLQELLNAVNLSSLKVDGIFGMRTEAAVKEFQKKNGLVVDGIVGPQTWSTLQYQFHD